MTSPVFVVPSVVETVSPAASEMVETAIAKFADYSGNIDKVNAYDKRPGAAPVVKR